MSILFGVIALLGLFLLGEMAFILGPVCLLLFIIVVQLKIVIDKLEKIAIGKESE